MHRIAAHALAPVRPLALALALGLALAAPGAVQAASKEYKVKAVFLYNFAKFIEWPAAAFAGASDPIRLCVLGEDPFEGFLEGAVAGKKASGRPVEVAHHAPGTAVEDLGDCHLLFIARSEDGRLDELVSGLAGSHVATVADSEGFAARGGAINFKPEGGKLRVELNAGAAEAQGLRVSAQLQQIATLVGS